MQVMNYMRKIRVREDMSGENGAQVALAEGQPARQAIDVDRTALPEEELGTMDAARAVAGDTGRMKREELAEIRKELLRAVRPDDEEILR